MFSSQQDMERDKIIGTLEIIFVALNAIIISVDYISGM